MCEYADTVNRPSRGTLQMVFGKLMSILTLETDASIDSLEHALLWLQDSRVRIRFVT